MKLERQLNYLELRMNKLLENMDSQAALNFQKETKR